MSDTVIVNWVPVPRTFGKTSYEHEWINVLVQEPKPYLQMLSSRRSASQYVHCPAFVDMYRNTFVVESPVDLNVQIDRENERFTVDNQPAALVNEFVYPHPGKFGKDDPFLLTIPPAILFFAAESVVMEQLPPNLLRNARLDNVDIVAGRFDIGRWVRPVDCTIEIRDTQHKLVVQAGDPLALVRFTAAEEKKVVLQRVLFDSRLEKAIRACTTVKTVRPNMKLAALYDAGEPYLTQLLADIHKEV